LRKKIIADSCDHIIITHGTDTMHLTGQALASIENKVIVITGAMRPASFKETDANFNIGAAFIAVQTLPPGVYMVMNGKIFDPTRVHKNFKIKAFEEKLT
ncbi:MAG: asparaginase domain-containing protein, partial [Bacteroidales bacterium]|nr:asparaginase domain-containing protein [Bacteroidales bacterium]